MVSSEWHARVEWVHLMVTAVALRGAFFGSFSQRRDHIPLAGH
jgi:hypothetical protein